MKRATAFLGLTEEQQRGCIAKPNATVPADIEVAGIRK